MSNKENKVKTGWVYQVILGKAECSANNINLRSSCIKDIFFGIPLTKLGEGPNTVFQLYMKNDGENVYIYEMDDHPPIVDIPNETIKAMIPVKLVTYQDI